MLRSTLFAACFIGTVALTGCGSGYSPVSGTVKLDGAPVEGATVTFVSEDGSRTYSGFTDASGNFSLQSGEKPGALAGNYKVTVVKTQAVPGAENMAPGGDAYLKQMMPKQKKAGSSTNPAVAVGAAAPGAKSELPTQYATVATTPLTATVPASDPVMLELKSK
jgi:hypothetical protein